MARAPSRRRLPRAPTYAQSRPLKPDELARLGYSPTSGRRVAKSVKRVTKTTKTWSERQTVQAGKGPYLDKAALAKAGFVEAPSSCFTMMPMTIAELWDREKANLRARRRIAGD
jgi:hypothetical protein